MRRRWRQGEWQRTSDNQPANEKEDKEVVVRRTTADKRREMTRFGGVGATTNQQTRDAGSKEEGEDRMGDSDETAMAAMDGVTVTAMSGNDGNGRGNGNTTATEGAMAVLRKQQRRQWKV